MSKNITKYFITKLFHLKYFWDLPHSAWLGSTATKGRQRTVASAPLRAVLSAARLGGSQASAADGGLNTSASRRIVRSGGFPAPCGAAFFARGAARRRRRSG